MTCGRLVSARVPRSSAEVRRAGFLSTTSWKLKVSGSEKSRVQEQHSPRAIWCECESELLKALERTRTRDADTKKQAQLWFIPQRSRVFS